MRRIKAELKSVSVGAYKSHSSDIQLDLAEATEQEAVAVCNHSTVLQMPKKKKHNQSDGSCSWTIFTELRFFGTW